MNRGLRLRALLVLGVTLVAVLNVLPSVVGEMPAPLSFLNDQKVRLGLDLQGGTHLVLTVDVDKALETSVNHRAEELLNELRKAKVRPSAVRPAEGTAFDVTFPPTGEEKFRALLEDQFPGLEIQGSPRRDGSTMTASIALNEAQAKELRRWAVEQSLETIRNRIDEFGVSEPVIARQGSRDILIQLPGVKDPQRAKNIIGRTAVLEFRFVRNDLKVDDYVDGGRSLPPRTEILYGSDKKDAYGVVHKGRPYVVESKVLLSGDSLVDARVRRGRLSTDYVVAFRLDRRGGRVFERITRENVGRLLAIVLDGKVNSAPRIKSRIPGGSGIIEGDFTAADAHDLAIVLRAGALPAPVKIAEERSVGPTLGHDSIHQGVISFLIAGALVVVFMVFYYRFAGVLADTALILNVLFLIAALAGFHATLTLPGIAGVVLTLGMAVDANVLINERIREELRLGKTPRSAIESGYERALPAILDSNATTFLAGIILFQFGSGPIKGFAVTLCIGIASSVFTAVVGTRIVYDFLLSQRRLKKVSI